MAKVEVDKEKCIGCGVCESLCEQCFKMNGGEAEFVGEDCGGCDLDQVIASCPTEAISKK